MITDADAEAEAEAEAEAPTTRWPLSTGLTLTLATFAVFVAHIMWVARFNVSTAQAIIADANITTTILGTVVPALPLVLVVALVLAPRYLARTKHPLAATVKDVPWYAGAVGVLTQTDLIETVGCAAIAAIVISYERKAEKRRVTPWQRGQRFLSYVAFTAFTALLIQPSPWVPNEVITFGPYGQHMTGYVLNDQSGGWTTVLRANDQTVIRIESNAITKRVICGSGSGWYEKSISQLVGWQKPQQYPSC